MDEPQVAALGPPASAGLELFRAYNVAQAMQVGLTGLGHTRATYWPSVLPETPYQRPERGPRLFCANPLNQLCANFVMQADTPGMADAAWSRLARVAKETATAKRQAAEAAAKQTAKQRAGGQGALSLAATSEKERDAAVVPEST